MTDRHSKTGEAKWKPISQIVYFGCLVEVWKILEPSHPYPWTFAVTHNGQRHLYGGIQNKCESKRSALRRAWWRAKWLSEGTYDEHYV